MNTMASMFQLASFTTIQNFQVFIHTPSCHGWKCWANTILGDPFKTFKFINISKVWFPSLEQPTHGDTFSSLWRFLFIIYGSRFLTMTERFLVICTKIPYDRWQKNFLSTLVGIVAKFGVAVIAEGGVSFEYRWFSMSGCYLRH
jgi:hypothetical protein